MHRMMARPPCGGRCVGSRCIALLLGQGRDVIARLRHLPRNVDLRCWLPLLARGHCACAHAHASLHAPRACRLQCEKFIVSSAKETGPKPGRTCKYERVAQTQSAANTTKDTTQRGDVRM